MKYTAEQRKMGKYARFVQGVNPTRIEKKMAIKSEDYYDQNAFDGDFNGDSELEVGVASDNYFDEFSLAEGDVVINNRLQLATLVSKKNAGKVYSLNFTKVILEGGLDKKYFLYVFNAYTDVQRQKNRETQGTGVLSASPRLSNKALGELMIPVPLSEVQSEIGEAYFESVRLKRKLDRYGQLIEKLTTGLLEEKLRGM